MGRLTHTVSGDIATFRSAARVPIESLKCHFLPKQDLHGYSKPWPAGGGKNLLNASTANKVGSDNFMSYTIENGTGFDINSENSLIGGYWVKVSSNTTYTYSYVSTYNGGSMHARVYELSEKYNSWTETDNNRTMLVNTTSWPGSESFTTGANTNWLIVGVYAYGVGLDAVITNMQIETGSTATSYEPYSNICPIEGWDECTSYAAGKNVAHVVGYSAASMSSPSSNRITTGSYRNTISTINPERSVTITQTQWPETNNVSSYKNGYFAIVVDNLQFGQRYDVSFKVENIDNNPLNASLSEIRGSSPAGNSFTNPTVSGNTLIYKNVLFKQNTSKPQQSEFCIYYCGMSFTFSDFMVTPANTSDGVYEPYSGSKFPVTFPVLGKNKFDILSATVGKFIRAGNISEEHPLGEIVDNSYFTLSDYILVAPQTQYTLTIPYYSSAAASGIVFFSNNAAGTEINGVREQSNFTYTAIGQPATYTFVTPDNCKYIRFSYYNTSGDNAQLELGDAATTYEPYSSNNTVYGGYVDFAVGEIVAEYKIIDLSMLTWTPYARTAGGEMDRIQSEVISDLSRPATTSETPSFVAEQLYPIPVGYNFTNYPNGLSVQLSLGYFYKYFDGEHYPQGRLAYKLSQSLHYPITFAKHTTFLNQNNFWSNTNSTTEVSYAIHDSAPIRAAKKRIIMNEPHIATVSGSIASFRTDMKAPLKECKVYFSPVQEGSGDPSPSNVRAISGWTGCEMYRTGKNIFDNSKIKIGKYVNWNNSETQHSSYSCSEYIKIKPDTYYTITIPKYVEATAAGQLFLSNTLSPISHTALKYYTKIGNTDNEGAYYTCLSPSNAQYLRISWQNNISDNCQIEEGQIRTSYEPYSGTTIQLDWQSAAGTIYGGYVDLVTGNVMKNWEYLALTSIHGKRGGTNPYFYRDLGDIGLIVNHAILCNRYKTVSLSTGNTNLGIDAINTTTYNKALINFRPEGYETLTVTELNEYLANNPTYVAYQLATPVLVTTFTPTQLKSLLGQNNIWSDGDTVQVKYWTH